MAAVRLTPMAMIQIQIVTLRLMTQRIQVTQGTRRVILQEAMAMATATAMEMGMGMGMVTAFVKGVWVVDGTAFFGGRSI